MTPAFLSAGIRSIIGQDDRNTTLLNCVQQERVRSYDKANACAWERVCRCAFSEQRNRLNIT